MRVLDKVLKDLMKINVIMRIRVPITEIEAVVRSMMISVSICSLVKPMMGGAQRL